MPPRRAGEATREREREREICFAFSKREFLLRILVLTDAAVDALGEQRPNGALTSSGGIADQLFRLFLSLIVVVLLRSPCYFSFSLPVDG